MAPIIPIPIHQGMKVFAGSEEIGKVTAVGHESFEVTHGLINRHVYVIPKKFIGDVGEDVVDLNIAKDQVDALESTGPAESAELPDEFKRIEGLEHPPGTRADDDDLLGRP